MSKEINRIDRVTYVCTGCGAANCRLWREYQTCADATKLLCCDCSEQNQKRRCKLDSDEPGMKHDQIGWLVPAVPTPEWDTFWGYTSVPAAGVKWWYDLPLRPRPRPLKKS